MKQKQNVNSEILKTLQYNDLNVCYKKSIHFETVNITENSMFIIY